MTDDTRKPVDELSGRELDRAVYSEVFGWTFTDDLPPGISEAWSDGDESYMEAHPDAPPPYSTDIAAAWEVADAIRQNGIRVEWDDRSEEWSAEVSIDWYERGTPGVFGSRADTAPKAICRAALRAVREVDDE